MSAELCTVILLFSQIAVLIFQIHLFECVHFLRTS